MTTAASTVPNGEGDLARSLPTSGSLVKVGSRLGVWGLVGGMGVMTAFTLGSPISLGPAIAVMGAGLLTSGLGTIAASVGVLRRIERAPDLIRWSAVIGVPLGGALALLGVTSLSVWSPLVSIVNAVTPVAAGLGAVVVVLLVLGFFMSPSDGDRASE